MGRVVDFQKYRTRREIDPVVAEIAEALSLLGGTAHRLQVADLIASRRAGRLSKASVDQADTIFAAFDRYLQVAARRRPAPLLWRPLGRDSYRWGLTETGTSLLAKRQSQGIEERVQ